MLVPEEHSLPKIQGLSLLVFIVSSMKLVEELGDKLHDDLMNTSKESTWTLVQANLGGGVRESRTQW